MVDVDFEGLYTIINKQRLLSSHWSVECLMMNCNTDIEEVAKEHKLFENAVRELRKALEQVENKEKSQFADYVRDKDIETIYG